MSPKIITLDPGEYELGMLDCDGELPELLCFVSADGADAFEFFGGAVVQGINEDGDMWKDWWVGSKRCPYRHDAIEILRTEWAKVHGVITMFEVERIFKLACPEQPKTFKTYGDNQGVGK